jgi:serine/threonine protein kinase
MKTIPKKLGRYTVIREVGRGSMGVVYKAHDPVIEREVAIKAIHLAFATSSEEKQLYLNRFYREAKAAGKLSHPNIVTIYDVNEDKETGVPFLVMEYLEGTTLQEIVVDGILLPLDDVNNIMCQIADALNYAHKQGVVHRDIKSANIILVEGMKPKITDFGIARMSTSDLTKSGQFMGTPNYMAPEQVDGKAPVDGRTDLFSLGVVFYLLLTGERPFSGDSFTAISYRIVHVDPVPPRTLNPAVPEVYNRILGRLLAKNPQDRYLTGADLIADIRKIGTETGPATGGPAAEPVEATVLTGSQTPAASTSGRHASVDLREVIASVETVPSVSGSPRLRRRKGFLALAGALMGIAVILAVVTFLHGSREGNDISTPLQKSHRKVAPAAVSSLPAKTQATLDLALNYYHNGFYDKSIELFEQVLRLDPKNPEAVKYIRLAQAQREQHSGPSPDPGSAVVPSTDAPAPIEPVESSPVKHRVPKAAPEKPTTLVKDAGLEFELEHPFPTGTFFIYMGDEILFQSPLSAKSKKLFVMSVHSGKLSGSLGIPSGEIDLRLQLVCPEQGISVEKKCSVKTDKGGKARMRVKYVKVSKQLEVRWL